MDFQLSPEQDFVRDTIRKFMRDSFPREEAHDLDERAAFPAKQLQELAQLGFCSLGVPEAYGGGGPDTLGAAIGVEEIAAVSPALAGAFASATLLGGLTISLLGSEEQKRELMPEIAEGSLLASYALHEASSEADADGLETRVIKQGQAFTLSGHKTSVSLVEKANYFLTLAQTGRKLQEQSLFLIAAELPSVRAQPAETVGFRGAEPGEVSFEGVALSPADVLGGPSQLNQGRQQLCQLEAVEHVTLSAIALGIAQGVYDYAAAYAEERVQFGQSLVAFEAIQHMLVDLATEIQAGRLLLYQACWQADRGQPFELSAAMAWLRAGDLARQAALDGVQILGGYGYMIEYDAQRYLRDSLTLLAGRETAEVLKNAIGAHLGLGQQPTVS